MLEKILNAVSMSQFNSWNKPKRKMGKSMYIVSKVFQDPQHCAYALWYLHKRSLLTKDWASSERKDRLPIPIWLSWHNWFGSTKGCMVTLSKLSLSAQEYFWWALINQKTLIKSLADSWWKTCIMVISRRNWIPGLFLLCKARLINQFIFGKEAMYHKEAFCLILMKLGSIFSFCRNMKRQTIKW